MALACYARQTHPRRELIVVDDGEIAPVDRTAIDKVGGSLLRLPPGTPLGDKLNAGFDQAKGSWCQKMDDDDWYGPGFLATMWSAVCADRTTRCRPIVAGVMPFIFFDLLQWELRSSAGNQVSGSTLFFAREDWKQRPFRPISRGEDDWFLRDQFGGGAVLLHVRAQDTFMAVRHRGVGSQRGHTWSRENDGQDVENTFSRLPLYRRPDELLSREDVAFYRSVVNGG
jgi:glycosyltransferase involved in cell wall biosynthesis